MSGSRPEKQNAPELFYDDKEASKYHASSRMINIQSEIAERALEMLALPPGKSCLILDIGCGSGLSGEILERHGHYWIGSDISTSMIGVAREKLVERMDEQSDENEDNDADNGDHDDDDDNNNGIHGINDDESEENEDETPVVCTGDLAISDMGQGLPFRPGSFDGVISVSAIQWLCYSNTSAQDPRLRLNRFFSSLYSVLKRDAKAVLQFYPENPEQAMLIAQCAAKVGFAGGLVVDFPNSAKAKKYYLCLSFERSYRVPVALGINESSVDMIERSSFNGKNRKKAHQRLSFKSRDWVVQKKERQRKQGKTIKSDSKYTGRKRAMPF